MYKYEILNRLIENGIVAIMRRVDKDRFDGVLKALTDGGIKCVEVTADSDGAFEFIRDMASMYGDRLCIGAGTILDPETCRIAIISGAQYIVTPTLNIDVIKTANRYGKPCIPGAMTPTEILTAYENGAEMVKVFPAGSLGPSYFKEVLGPLSHIPLMATGGVTIDNISEFKKAGVKAFGIGSALIDREAVRVGDFDKIEDIARKFVEACVL
ncbi:bifunctional 4-hydroxy-2-oxoglutarate aldolase/2-dehydro-3-deoxy-phosphogluconate aldolase [Calorimonas adulescens]|jgi:Entner-Doudoroff aldolase|uniref:Bifunctional 4-hydroxy-2-oxoglutarate aldolase/2-dehydro-3-deoxy-phosphogluconate aldolase n=1 Tax=Calorimonas adulescens TaxID=2606906 RepID=A0A5D8QF23_9THEO|nr:bifunctional 4-hydroxy-2-oxoglutarate aldolase/2-dehydro-3-deoxy-phosphogluconate aldolase [Calorimonas adulescens]TZE82779.1 bifunctional 4-hydroxy-2-oxoglutarate aldolase/2-dehydro-3-deoxy-phosphogluconate aldolase [Calorimonas adulescens]